MIATDHDSILNNFLDPIVTLSNVIEGHILTCTKEMSIIVQLMCSENSIPSQCLWIITVHIWFHIKGHKFSVIMLATEIKNLGKQENQFCSSWLCFSKGSKTNYFYLLLGVIGHPTPLALLPSAPYFSFPAAQKIIEAPWLLRTSALSWMGF